MKRPVERREDPDLYDHLLRECVGMAKYALSGGTAIPAAAAETINLATEVREQERKAVASDGKAPGACGSGSRSEGTL